MNVSRTRSAAAMLLWAMCGGAGAAQDVYRCGNAYSQVPCAEGTSVAVDDSRSAAQRAEAASVAAREANLARQMTQDRERAEAAARKATPMAGRTNTRVAGATPNPKTARRSRAKSHLDDQGNFVSYLPAPKKSKK